MTTIAKLARIFNGLELKMKSAYFAIVFVMFVNLFIAATFWIQIQETSRRSAQWEDLARRAIGTTAIVERQRDEAIRQARACLGRD